jgi:mevalonate kinase
MGRGSSAAVGVASITELLESHQLTLNTGVLVNTVRGEVEVSYQSHPIEAAHDVAFDVFRQCVGSATDYRNFQDPLQRF